MAGKKVVLAFSGGLDTSYCVMALVRDGYEVHTAFVNTGGVTAADRDWIRQRALSLGAVRHHELDASVPLWESFVVPLVRSQARMLDAYPMLCSDRYVIVQACLALCDELGTDCFAHGCTGMGNDQLRFDQSVRSLGDYEILAPIRDLQREPGPVREREIALLAEAGVSVPESSSRYSINQNLLGVTLSGGAIDVFGEPEADTRVWCVPRSDWPAEPLRVRIGFEGGRPVSLDGEALDGPALLDALNKEFGAYGVGRHIYTGDVTIGLKGRIVFECPGIDALMAAHRALTEAVNTRWQQQFHATVGQRWAELVYGGFFFEPHKTDLEAYLESANGFVTGTVTLFTDGGTLAPVAVDSPYRMEDGEAVYAQSAKWSAADAEGFIKLAGQSSTLAARVRREAS